MPPVFNFSDDDLLDEPPKDWDVMDQFPSDDDQDPDGMIFGLFCDVALAAFRNVVGTGPSTPPK